MYRSVITPKVEPERAQQGGNAIHCVRLTRVDIKSERPQPVTARDKVTRFHYKDKENCTNVPEWSRELDAEGTTE
jgi:hypothetical protein